VAFTSTDEIEIEWLSNHESNIYSSNGKLVKAAELEPAASRTEA